MRVQKGKKGIKTGEYFVKKGEVYVVGTAEEKGILSGLSYAISEKDARVYVLVDYNKLHFFDLERLKYQYLDRNLLDKVLMVYPNAFVLEVSQQTRGKVSKRGIEVDKRKALVSVMLLSVVVSLYVFNDYYKKKREEAERVRRMQEMARLQVQQRRQIVLPPCNSNLGDFMSKYIFPAYVEGGAVVVQTEDITVRVPLVSRQVSRVGSVIKVYLPDITYAESRLPDGGLSWQFKNFESCLEFIYKNRHLPLSVVSLKGDGCQINLVGGCLYDQKGF
jgi:hypothetical protein